MTTSQQPWLPPLHVLEKFDDFGSEQGLPVFIAFHNKEPDLDHDVSSLERKLGIDPTHSRPILNSFRLDSSLTPVDMEPYRRESAQGQLGDYFVTKDSGVDSSNRFTGLYHDSPYSFVLLHMNRFIASASFRLYDQGALITEIQGRAGKEYGMALKPLKWEDFLIQCIEDCSIELGLPEVQVLPHYRNNMKRVREDGKFRARYGRPAIRRGFILDREAHLYRKGLK